MADASDQRLLEKADQILRVLVLTATREMNQREQIAFLSAAGFQPKAIAELIGTTSNNVRVALSSLRKTDGKKGAWKSSATRKRHASRA